MKTMLWIAGRNQLYTINNMSLSMCLIFAEGGFPFRINSAVMFCVMGAEAVFIIILLWAASARKKFNQSRTITEKNGPGKNSTEKLLYA